MACVLDMFAIWALLDVLIQNGLVHSFLFKDSCLLAVIPTRLLKMPQFTKYV